MAEVAPPAPPPVEEGDKNPLPPPPPPPPMTTLLVTDAMMIGGEDLRKQPYAERLKAAQMLCLALQRDHLETPAPGLPAPSHILFQVKPVYALADLATAIETVQAGTVEHNSLVGLGRRGVGGCMQLGVFFFAFTKMSLVWQRWKTDGLHLFPVAGFDKLPTVGPGALARGGGDAPSTLNLTPSAPTGRLGGAAG